MSKRMILILALVPALCLLSACAKEAAPKNEIAPIELSAEQQEIVDLLDFPDREILLFEHHTDDSFTEVEFWVEVYEYGQLVDRPSGIHAFANESLSPVQGRLAVTISYGEETQWSFTHSSGGGKITHRASLRREGGLPGGRSYGPVHQAVEIEAGREIVLYACIFSDGGISAMTDLQIYLEEPERLAGYPLVHLIKAKFS